MRQFILAYNEKAMQTQLKEANNVSPTEFQIAKAYGENKYLFDVWDLDSLTALYKRKCMYLTWCYEVPSVIHPDLVIETMGRHLISAHICKSLPPFNLVDHPWKAERGFYRLKAQRAQDNAELSQISTHVSGILETTLARYNLNNRGRPSDCRIIHFSCILCERALVAAGDNPYSLIKNHVQSHYEKRVSRLYNATFLDGTKCLTVNNYPAIQRQYLEHIYPGSYLQIHIIQGEQFFRCTGCRKIFRKIGKRLKDRELIELLQKHKCSVEDGLTTQGLQGFLLLLPSLFLGGGFIFYMFLFFVFTF